MMRVEAEADLLFANVHRAHTCTVHTIDCKCLRSTLLLRVTFVLSRPYWLLDDFRALLRGFYNLLRERRGCAFVVVVTATHMSVATRGPFASLIVKHKLVLESTTLIDIQAFDLILVHVL